MYGVSFLLFSHLLLHASNAAPTTFAAPCLPPPGVVSVDLTTAAFEEDLIGALRYTLDPSPAGGSTLTQLVLVDGPFSDDQTWEQISITAGGDLPLVGLTAFDADLLTLPQVPSTIDFDDWDVGTVALSETVFCDIQEVVSGEDVDLVVDVVGATPGFESVLDSGRWALSSAAIHGRLQALRSTHQAQGCVVLPWAGTWSRQRNPRVVGETLLGAPILGTSVSSATVDGVDFSASLASGGRLRGSTTSGTVIDGFFTRVNGTRSIWYAVEANCPVD